MTDYSMLLLLGYPNEGQTLEQVRELLLGELAKLRAGNFDDDLLVSVVNNNKLQYLRALDSNGARTRQLVNAFINHVDWAQEVGKLDRMAGMTKDQIVAFANRHLLDNNFVCVYKRMGVDTTEKKIDKPAITPIPTNRDKQSDFVRNILGEIVEPIQPQFVDYSKEMTVGQTSKKLPLLYKHNDLDDLFTLTYKYDFGATADNRYETALSYMDFLGTKKMSATEFKQRLYKLACNISMNVSDNETYLTLSGLSENMPEALKLAEDLMQNAQVDEDAYMSMVDVILKSRNDAKSSQDECFSRLSEYGMYGPRNEYTNIMSEQQLRDTKPAELINLVKGLKDMQHTVVYYGPMTEKELNKCLSKVHKTKKNLAAVPVGRACRNHQPVQRVLRRQHERHRLPGVARSTRSGLFGCRLLSSALRDGTSRVCHDLHHHPERQDDGLHQRVQQHRGHHSPERGRICPCQGVADEETRLTSHRAQWRVKQLHGS